MTVIDCFMYAGERDVLALRLKELEGVVDVHVIVEGAVTFQGEPRELAIQHDLVDLRYDGRTPLFLHLVSDFPPFAGPWEREAHLRNSMARALDLAAFVPEPADDAVILLSDVDEIPRPEAIPPWLQPGETGRIGMRHFQYFVNLEQVTHTPWFGTRCIRLDDLRKTSPQALRGFGIGHTAQPGDRFTDGSGGWHLSFLGGVEAIQRKLRSWAHAEANRPRYTDAAWLARCLEDGTDWYRERDLELRWVDLDHSFPASIRADPARWAHLIGPPIQTAKEAV